jgi:hypothetical protein
MRPEIPALLAGLYRLIEFRLILRVSRVEDRCCKSVLRLRERLFAALV